jgi:hypothetical protein
MWISASIMTTVIVFANAVEVHSTGVCPSGEAIAAKLGPLLAGQGGDPDVAWVEVAAQKPDGITLLRLRLLRPDGSVVGDRRLTLQGGCDEMADSIATVLAAWKTPPAPATSQTEAVAATASPVPATSTRPLQAWLGIGGGVALVGTLAASGNLELAMGRPAWPVRARAAAFTQTRRRRDLDSGTVSWRRTHGELGLGWQSRGTASGSYWQASADLDLLLGWLSASGSGFFQNDQQDAFEYGAGAGLRGERKLGAWALWLEGRANLWARRQRAVLSNSPSTAELPRFDVLVTLGVSRLIVR